MGGVVSIILEYSAPLTVLHIWGSIFAKDDYYKEYLKDLLEWKVKRKFEDKSPRTYNATAFIRQTSSRKPILDMLTMDSLPNLKYKPTTHFLIPTKKVNKSTRNLGQLVLVKSKMSGVTSV